MTATEEVLLARHLARSVLARASGAEVDECTVNSPRDVYFVGSLRPAYVEPEKQSTRPAYLDELLSKLAPHAFGAEFLTDATEGTFALKVRLRWKCFYRVFPEFQQQREHQRIATQDVNASSEEAAGEATDDEIEDIPDTAPAASPRRKKASNDELFRRFKAIRCTAGAVVRISRESGGWAADVAALNKAVTEELQRARAVVSSDPMHLRTGADSEERVKVPASALASEESYAAFRLSLRQSISPAWKWSIDLSFTPGPGRDELVVFFTATNASEIASTSWHSEGFFFNVEADFSLAGARLLPFILEAAPRGFRYDRRVWGRGFNCGLVHESSDGGDFLSTVNAPVFEQPRYRTRTEPPTRFDELAGDPIPVLRAVAEAMRRYDDEWEAAGRDYSRRDTAAWRNRHASEFEEDWQIFRNERERFLAGMRLVEDDADIRLAFQLTNRAFAENGRHSGKEAWRLFQLVFLVTQLTGFRALVSSTAETVAEREIVDIIYFPTGGGKTEAYLATIVFHCFYDRLRGKSAGVTAWTRFPLRLLTLQQMQRVADVIGAAELIRRRHDDARLSGRDIDGFAVGYFVGQEATPNELTPPRHGAPSDPTWSIATDPDERQKWKKIVACPSCGPQSSVIVDLDAASVRLLHRCTNKHCSFPDGILPVYVVDNEIYRYLPTVVVGTIDKLAGIGNQRKLSMVLGAVTGKCIVHNYYSAKCCQKDCTDPKRLRAQAPKGLSGPTLFVQDELHLLKEGLGTFDGHYETFLQALLRRIGRPLPVKIIASSATIEAFDRQVEHLYGRLARVFPGTGPTLRSSFYARTEEYPQRLYVGLLPHNKTIFNAVLEIVQYYQEEVDGLRSLQGGGNPFGGETTPGSPQWLQLLDPYLTSLTYFSAVREMGGIRTDLDTHVNVHLERAGRRLLRIAELSGSTPTDEVTRILERLQSKGLDPERAPNAILATSMVSHGVDIDRLNFMLFYGMPKATAEYIQASSRVGRSHVGVVFAVLKPARERDQSHFVYFDKYHEFMGRLVEPVAINRWSKFSIGRTIPGLFMGVILQHLAQQIATENPNRFYMAEFIKKMIDTGKVSEMDFLPILNDAYLVNRPGPGAAAFSNEIPRFVELFLQQIVNASHATFVSEALIPTPMRSLRDVDEAITIELDADGSAWGSRTGR